jgi:hypothetical protein
METRAATGFIPMRGGGPKPSFCGADLAQPVVENKKAQRRLGFFVLESQGNSGRGERIRTSGLYVPNVALYQAKLHPDGCKKRESSFVVT